jgi:hypothetical protein
MSAQLSMFGQEISADTPNAISSQELESGPTPCASPDGLITDPSGQEAARARHSRQRAKGEGLTTLVTSGRSGIPSSASAALQLSLENRLMMRLDTAGSTLFRLTWKRRSTPLRRPYLERAVSVPRTSARDFISWPTPCTPNGGRSMSTARMDATGRKADGSKHTASLEHAVKFSAWPTPKVRTGKYCYSGGDHTKIALNLEGSADLANYQAVHLIGFQGIPARLTATGEILTGSAAQMESGGQLDPAHSRWLIGLPPEWDACAVTAMQSFRKSRKPLSDPTWSAE